MRVVLKRYKVTATFVYSSPTGPSRETTRPSIAYSHADFEKSLGAKLQAETPLDIGALLRG